MTKYIEFQGKALFAQVWPDQIDREYEDEKRGGNYSIKLIVDNENLSLFNALGSKAKAKRIEDMKEATIEKFGLQEYLDKKYLTFRRYERLSNNSPLSAVEVTGVDPGTAIGNLSDVTVTVEHYTTEYKEKPVVGIRLVSVRVDNLVTYVKPEPVSPDNTPPVH